MAPILGWICELLSRRRLSARTLIRQELTRRIFTACPPGDLEVSRAAREDLKMEDL